MEEDSHNDGGEQVDDGQAESDAASGDADSSSTAQISPFRDVMLSFKEFAIDEFSGAEDGRCTREAANALLETCFCDECRRVHRLQRR